MFASTPDPRAPSMPVRLRVMVVDDSLTVRKITGRLLSREGYQVEVAKDGVEALEKIQEQRPDVMITDVEMPYMDGIEVAKAIRGDPRTSHLPILLLTALTLLLVGDDHRFGSGEGNQDFMAFMRMMTSSLDGETLDVAFIGWVRHEQSFETIDDLKRYMADDSAKAREALARAPDNETLKNTIKRFKP